MPSANMVVLIGHLGQDPKMTFTSGGTCVANMSLATTEKYKDKKTTHWHRIVCFGKLADICGKYLRKGAPVYISGRIQYRKWTGKDGVIREVTEIVANEMQMLGSRQDSHQPRQMSPAEVAAEMGAEIVAQTQGDLPGCDDIPF